MKFKKGTKKSVSLLIIALGVFMADRTEAYNLRYSRPVEEDCDDLGLPLPVKNPYKKNNKYHSYNQLQKEDDCIDQPDLPDLPDEPCVDEPELPEQPDEPCVDEPELPEQPDEPCVQNPKPNHPYGVKNHHTLGSPFGYNNGYKNHHYNKSPTNLQKPCDDVVPPKQVLPC